MLSHTRETNIFVASPSMEEDGEEPSTERPSETTVDDSLTASMFFKPVALVGCARLRRGENGSSAKKKLMNLTLLLVRIRIIIIIGEIDRQRMAIKGSL